MIQFKEDMRTKKVIYDGNALCGKAQQILCALKMRSSHTGDGPWVTDTAKLVQYIVPGWRRWCSWANESNNKTKKREACWWLIWNVRPNERRTPLGIEDETDLIWYHVTINHWWCGLFALVCIGYILQFYNEIEVVRRWYIGLSSLFCKR